MKTDVVVLGAGAIGLTLAYELSRRGRSVTVVERDRLGPSPSRAEPEPASFRTASSWAAAGILPPANLETATDPIERLRGLSHQRFPGLVEQLKRESGIDPQLSRCGGWYLSDSPGETASMVGMSCFWKELAIECDERDVSELSRHEPALASWAANAPGARAWWVPDEYQICTPFFLDALVQACRLSGVRFLDQTRAADLVESETGVCVSVVGRSQPDQRVDAEQAVLCGGVWSGLIAQRLQLSRSLVPVRGQMLLLRTDGPILNSIINFGQRYLVPRRNGDVLVGSCEEEVGLQHGTTPAVLEEFRQFARQVCPPLKSAREIAAWSGLRPLTFDGFPRCGKLPGSESVFVASGHYRSGIHLSPGTAQCMADLMTGENPPIEMSAFAVGKMQLEHQGFTA